MGQKFTIVRQIASPAKIFYVEGINGISESLEQCARARMSPLFMPELAIARTYAPKEHIVWETELSTPSVIVTGRTRKGNPVVVYAHVPTSLIDPNYLKRFINKPDLFGSSYPIKNDEFYSLLKREDNKKVFVVDYDKLRRSSFGIIKVDDALAHPQTIPFLGGEQIAKAYLDKYTKVHWENISVRYSGGDLIDRPIGRFLFLDSLGELGLDGYSSVFYNGKFVSVASMAQSIDGKLYY